mmetsp:Transcript_23020/g.26271  ORF Transcript_23020/g.26271 Transcript_23020/m.26271 type:complete len:144 (+) Transcript_23020:64-495(+)|eukprot:CAMPEP_0194143964 /NCGR_PEP_ID=MMETSP0152-20130528/13061_1 /TAXON_ID=1049557 /ORGANISM="Thalassiothrix antarctica, Strain L6-D1" /LENGTH=143 /DNA_ID=CAMNT_0038843605 /DNA_START=66 /DNA_END=497 /DNA_ORIENTATION=+
MRVIQSTRTALTAVVLFPATTVTAFAPAQRYTPQKTALFSKEIMSDMDIMCITNAADLCSYYDECDIEEREAMLNRFDEQTDLLADRMATINAISKHLRTGDHKHLEDKEVADMKLKIMSFLDNKKSDYLDDMEVVKLQEEEI